MGAILTEQGIPNFDRKAFYSARDYLTMAGNIAKPATSDSPLAARLTSAPTSRPSAISTCSRTISPRSLPLRPRRRHDHQHAAAVLHSGCFDRDSDGNTTNIDNRRQIISIAVTGSTVKVGDAFTIAGVNSVHHISKQNTGQLKTFRITRIVTGAGGTGTVEITPPIISNGGSTRAESEYKNVNATPVNGAVITFLNTVAANANLFFVKGAIELIPGSFAVNSDDGWNLVAKGTTPKLGLPITYVARATSTISA
jgi:hypothetical protein